MGRPKKAKEKQRVTLRGKNRVFFLLEAKKGKEKEKTKKRTKQKNQIRRV